MTIDLNDFVAGGYFITKYADRPEYKAEDLLPERLVSLSWDINPGTVNVYWEWDVEKHRDEALDFAIPAEKLPDLATWSQAIPGVDIGHSNVFYSLNAAQKFINGFLPVRDDLVLIGAALPNSLVDTFLNENRQRPPFFANEQEYKEALYGEDHVLSERRPLPSGGEVLGFEIVSHYAHLGCSWLCSGLERKMFQEFGIRPGKYGLIETFEEANKVYEWILEGEKLGEQRAEPEPYYPWLIVQYPPM